MPKTKVDYSKTSIYKLVHKNDFSNESIYIGSTSNFVNRRYQHKHSCVNENNNHHNEPMYNHIRENGGWDNWIMVELEKYPCNDKREAETRERYWIELCKSSLNKKIPTRSKQEYEQINKETLSQIRKEYQKEYNIQNMSRIKEIREQKVKCECGCEVAKYKLSRHQQTAKHIKFISTHTEI
tara:strand:+ start:108 stop:653 length:546 start_codon:yes stop_codon:yes gene_type:complete